MFPGIPSSHRSPLDLAGSIIKFYLLTLIKFSRPVYGEAVQFTGIIFMTKAWLQFA